MLKLKRNNGSNNSLLTLEASAERERVKKFMNDNLGNGYFDKYLKVRDRLTDPSLKDFNKIITLDPEDVKTAIDRYNTTPTGKKTVGENSDWIVLHVTDFSDAQELGEGSEWCITGRYPDTDPDDPHYFNDYISKYNLDGGYYFYIPKDGSNDKYCLLLTKNGDINSIWATPNHKLRSEDLKDLNFPTVRGINLDDYDYNGYEGYDDHYEDRLREQMEDAYRRDDADTWFSYADDIEEAGGNVEYPYLLDLFYNDKPHIFDSMLDMGVSLESDVIEYILDGLYLRQIKSPSDWLPMIKDYIDLDDLGYCIRRMIDYNSYAGLEDFIRDFHNDADLFSAFYMELDFDKLIAFLNREEFTKEMLDAVTDDYLEPKIIGILDDIFNEFNILERDRYIVDFLKVLDKKGINVKPAFEEGRVLNLAKLLLDEDTDLSYFDRGMIEGLIKLGAQIKPDEIKALKERIDSLDEDDRKYIAKEILDLVEASE